MEFFKPGVTYDFFKYRWPFIFTSLGLTILSLVSLFWPGPRLGIDFKGGTEIEVSFENKVSAAELRAAVLELGFGQPEVIEVQGTANRFLLRLEQVSALPAAQVQQAKAELEKALGGAGSVVQLDASPGGDKLTLRLNAAADVAVIEGALTEAGMKLRAVAPFGKPDDFRYEAQLVGVGDKLVAGLREKLKEPPKELLRVEWVGPKAGEQLRDAAAKSLLYAIAFIMVYVAFRFDLRFAPGAVIALAHDALITFGVYVLFQKEVTLGTVAAVLTVIGFSINDTIVIYDRIRENMARMRDASLVQLINVSTSQTMGRTIVTSGTALISIAGFFVWGTPLLQDIVFAITIGFLVGVYSTVYVAGPLTEWIDRRFFRKT